MHCLGPSTLQIWRLDLKVRLEKFSTLTSPDMQNNAIMTSYICISWKHNFSCFRSSLMPVGFCALRSPKCVIRPPESKLPHNSLRKFFVPFWVMFGSFLLLVFSNAKPKVARPVMVKPWRKYFPLTSSANTCNRPPDTKVIKKAAGSSEAPFLDMMQGSLLRFAAVLQSRTSTSYFWITAPRFIEDPCRFI